MSQISSDNIIDPNRVYCTNALIKKVGRAMTVSLSDATLPGNARNKHMTIFYRGDKKFTDVEIELMSKETDHWIKQQYGNNKAPVTFTIAAFGRNSVKIQGDLYALCLHLRTVFATMSRDAQRMPYCKLFANGHGRFHNNNNNNNNKCCHICGDSTHFKKHCPQKQQKKTCKICGEFGHFKRECPQKKVRRNSKKYMRYVHGKNNNENVEQQLQRMICKTADIKQEKQNEIKLLDEQQQKLQALLVNSENLDEKTVRNEINNIACAFRNKRKEMKRNRKCMRRNRKYEKKEMKYQKKEQKKLEKQQTKLEKKEMKKIKKEKFEAKEQIFETEMNDKNQIHEANDKKDAFVDIMEEIEGFNNDENDENMEIVTPENDESDYEFTSIFGEDINIININ